METNDFSLFRKFFAMRKNCQNGLRKLATGQYKSYLWRIEFDQQPMRSQNLTLV